MAHDCIVGSGAVVSNAVLLGGHCRLGSQAVVGGGAAVAQRAEVGAFAFVAGGAMVEGRHAARISNRTTYPVRISRTNLFQ